MTALTTELQQLSRNALATASRESRIDRKKATPEEVARMLRSMNPACADFAAIARPQLFRCHVVVHVNHVLVQELLQSHGFRRPLVENEILCRERGMTSPQRFAGKKRLREAGKVELAAVQAALDKEPHHAGPTVRLSNNNVIVIPSNLRGWEFLWLRNLQRLHLNREISRFNA